VIHGTPQPWTIGSRASHGCIRLRRPDIEKLYELVPEHTPVFIVP
jgi:lipoprotein-anchoring transpeptidase ErfK/SrfK